MTLLLTVAPCVWSLRTTSSLPVTTDFEAQWSRLMTLREQNLPVTEPETVPFSAVMFQRAGAQLVSWLPDSQGGEMVLDTPWQTIPPLFPLLASCGMVIRAFSVQPWGEKLRLTLHLEALYYD